MAAISLKDCADDTPGQEWNLMEDGRIALDASKPRKPLSFSFLSLFLSAFFALTTLDRGMHRPPIHEGHGQQPRRTIRMCRARRHWCPRQGNKLAPCRCQGLNVLFLAFQSRISKICWGGVALLAHKSYWTVDIMSAPFRRKINLYTTP